MIPRIAKPAVGDRVGWVERAQPALAHRDIAAVGQRRLQRLDPPYRFGHNPGHWKTILFRGALLLISAAPPTADDWERRGNEAFADARFDEAAKCYAAAEDASGEPGRVAFNHGVALFNLGKYRD